MTVFPALLRLFFFAFTLAFCSLTVCAQTAIWSRLENIQTKSTRQIRRSEGLTKRWKANLQQWGTDTSFRQSLSLAGRLNTHGWSAGLLYQSGSGRALFRGSRIKPLVLWSLNLSEIIHEKQAKQQRGGNSFPELGKARPYIFGKTHHLYLLQLGYGRQHLLFPKVLEGNISISFRYTGGFSMAILKPYYLDLIYTEYTPDQIHIVRAERYSQENKEVFLNRQQILGSSGWRRGLDRIRYVPGLFANAALVLQPSQSKSFIKMVSLGADVSGHIKELPIMADQKARSCIAGWYVGLSLGKCWK